MNFYVFQFLPACWKHFNLLVFVLLRIYSQFLYLSAYGVSVQEALDSEVPVIASDVCVRPRGALLFESGNYEKLKELFEKVIFSESNKNFLIGYKPTDYHFKLLDLYRKSLNK